MRDNELLTTHLLTYLLPEVKNSRKVVRNENRLIDEGVKGGVGLESRVDLHL